MDNFPQTQRTILKRLPKRGVFDRQKIYEILDEGLVCHLGFSIDAHPFVIPTGYGRLNDDLFIHGSAASRTLRTLAGRVEVCVTVTIIDGLVLARSAFHHSMNYRSVIIFGRAVIVEEPAKKMRALRAFSDHIVPHRWDHVRGPNDSELKKTLVLRLPLAEASAKIRTGPPLDDESDYDLPIWAGEIPLRLAAQTPVPDPRLSPEVAVPSYVESYLGYSKRSPPTDVMIRRAGSQDAAAVASILEKAFVEYRELYTEKGYAATVLTAEDVKARMAEGPIWVALDSAQIVGTVAAVAKDEGLYLRSMAIVPEARGKRIGKLLLKQVERFAVTHGHKEMTLNTTPFLSRAIALYEHFGFTRSDNGPLDLFGTPLFSMIKSL
jgi:uncharacterized protein